MRLYDTDIIKTNIGLVSQSFCHLLPWHTDRDITHGIHILDYHIIMRQCQDFINPERRFAILPEPSRFVMNIPGMCMIIWETNNI